MKNTRNTTNGIFTLNEIKKCSNTEKIGVVYHEDMDGIIGAVCIKARLKSLDNITEEKVEYIPTQYGKDKILNFEKMVNFDFLLFIDFCPSVMEILELFENGNKNIHIFDHHLTQIIKIMDNDKEVNSLSKKYPGFKYYFDNTKAGCGIAYDQFIDESLLENDQIRKLAFASNYAEDRDLWKWDLENSKEINAGFDILMNSLEIKHNPEAWYQILMDRNHPEKMENLLNKYPEIDFSKFHTDSGFKQVVENLGVSKIRYDKAYIDKIVNAATKGKIPKININGIEMFVLNNSYLISEVGNALTQFDYPSCQWFVIHEVKDGLLKEPELILSFRSNEDLPDVSMVATALGGGGHRNACGATLSIDQLKDLLIGKL